MFARNVVEIGSDDNSGGKNKTPSRILNIPPDAKRTASARYMCNMILTVRVKNHDTAPHTPANNTSDSYTYVPNKLPKN